MSDWITVSPTQVGAGDTLVMTIDANSGSRRSGYALLRGSTGTMVVIVVVQS
jgi:hypothetical protein